MRFCTKLVCICGLSFLLLIQSAAAARDDHATKPNIVVFLADDLGWTGLRCFGSDLYETPNLDALAARGLKLTSAYSACTVCSPTRASIMTGMYPARLRCTDFIAGQNRPFAKLQIPDWTKRLDSSHVTVAEWLKDRGYRTGHVGKWHLNSKQPSIKGTDARSQGFDFSAQKPPRSKGNFVRSAPPQRDSKVPNPSSTDDTQADSTFVTDYLTERALEFLDDSTDSPFFLYFAYHVPHTPVVGRPDLVAHFKEKVRPSLRHKNADFAAMVSSMDSSVARVLERVDQIGATENTIVIFISDNGGLTQRYGKIENFTDNHPLRRGKGSAYEGGVRVPAIVYWPGVTTPNSVSNEPIMTIDIFPTIAAAVSTAAVSTASESMAAVSAAARSKASAAGSEEGEKALIALPSEVDGIDLRPLLRNPGHHFDRDLFWHYPHYHAGGDGPYSAIRSGNFRLIEFHEDHRLELYDLENDLYEQQDLAKSHPEKAKLLHQKLIDWRNEIGAQMPTPNPNYNPDRAMQVGQRGTQTATSPAKSK